MQLRRRVAAFTLAVPLLLAGCDVPGRTSGMEPASNGSAAGSGEGWTVVAKGKPSPSPTRRAAKPSASPSRRPLAAASADPFCAFAWSAGQVVIPLTVVPQVNAATVTWPRTGDPAPAFYRIAAVPQRLVAGEQPEIEWRTIPAAPGCRTTTTITGLVSGREYVLWLDAPDSGHQPDGTPRPTHGRSELFQAL